MESNNHLHEIVEPDYIAVTEQVAVAAIPLFWVKPTIFVQASHAPQGVSLAELGGFNEKIQWTESICATSRDLQTELDSNSIRKTLVAIISFPIGGFN